MKDEERLEIRDILISFGKVTKSNKLFPVVIPGADELIYSDLYAFSFSVCLDRGMKAEIIWTIPYDLKSILGHFDPRLFYQMSVDKLAALFYRLPRRPRYSTDAPRTIRDLTRIVYKENDGDAGRIWKGKNAQEVKKTIASIFGVGPGIANMSVLLIEKAFGIQFNDIDHRKMDIKPDVHTKRVLFRLGARSADTELAAIEAARQLNPDYPGLLDLAFWEIGRTWCSSTNPNCSECIMRAPCKNGTK